MDAAVGVPARRGLHRRSGQAGARPSGTFDAADRPADRGSRDAETPDQGHAPTWGQLPDLPPACGQPVRSPPDRSPPRRSRASSSAGCPRRFLNCSRDARAVAANNSATPRSRLTSASDAETSEPGSAARPTATSTRGCAARPAPPARRGPCRPSRVLRSLERGFDTGGRMKDPRRYRDAPRPAAGHPARQHQPSGETAAARLRPGRAAGARPQSARPTHAADPARAARCPLATGLSPDPFGAAGTRRRHRGRPAGRAALTVAVHRRALRGQSTARCTGPSRPGRSAAPTASTTATAPGHAAAGVRRPQPVRPHRPRAGALVSLTTRGSR